MLKRSSFLAILILAAWAATASAQTATPTATATATATATPTATPTPLMDLGPTAITIRALGSLVSNVPDLGNAIEQLQYERDFFLKAGSGPNQGDTLFQRTDTVAASSSETLQLNGGSLTDEFGNTLSFTSLKLLIVYASPNNTNNVVVGGAGSDTLASPFGAANNTVTLQPGGILVLIAPAGGYAVSSSTSNLKIANGSSGSSVTFDVIALGI
jgi:hypothetical protein